MRNRIKKRLTGLLAGLVLSGMVGAGGAWAQDTSANEGGDIAFGGPGSGPGQFMELRDITFDARGNLYALDGARLNNQTKAREGNLRVQKFDAQGKYLSAFSIASDALGERQDPQRIAVLADGTAFVTQPQAGLVQVLGPDGKARRDVALPHAMAITKFGSGASERIAVVPSRNEVVDGKWQWQGGDKIIVLNASGETERTIALDRKLENVQDVTADLAGSFYIQAEPNAIYKFSAGGKLLKTFGGNPTTRNPDGSEVLHTVAVDSKGNVFTMAWGNPGVVTRFDADGQAVTQREGQFKWADPWSVHSEYTPLAIDPSDRLWAAATHRFEDGYVHLKTQRAAPAIVRARAEFFEAPANSVKRAPIRMLGFRPSVTSALPYNIAYEAGKPIAMAISIAKANRSVSEVTASWQITDAFKHEISKGQAKVALENGVEGKASFAFTPPRFGYYFVRCAFSSGGQPMGALGEHVGVTPRFAGVPTLEEGESKGGWTDAPRQMWTGLPNMRLHPNYQKLDELEEQIALAEKYHATFLVQLVDNQKNFKPENVRALMARFKGRIRYVEVCNEPNFSGSAEEYFAIHKAAYDIIHVADPTVQVMGPGTVNIDLGWLKRLYELGFKSCSDAISLHDYEGHESITPEHWTWKFAQVRAIMAANGDSAKPVWQTERAISGVRGNNFQGLVQAIRTTMHRDLLETLGIPSEHNNHYYLNQGGYSDVPTYVWSAQGPHPAALALRTRYALTAAINRKYLGTLDFGPTGNTFLMGVRYGNAQGQTVVLRNLGTRPTPVEFSVADAANLSVVDCWGNAIPTRVAGGKLSLSLEQLPVYLRLGAEASAGATRRSEGASFSPVRLDFGRNVAQRAAWHYTSSTKSDSSLLTNGVYETHHSGDPNGDTNGDKIWTGDLPLDSGGQPIPQTLEADFGRAQVINKVIVRGVRGDNSFCTLLDYDLDFYDGQVWKSIEKVRSQMPASEEAATADSTHAIWMDDTNLFVHRFAPVEAQRLRLVARRASFGFIPDGRARAWGSTIVPRLMLREFEVFAPTLPITLAAEIGTKSSGTTISAPPPSGGQELAVTVRNRGSQKAEGSLKVFAPAGWKVSGRTPDLLDLRPNQGTTVQMAATPPQVLEAGRAFFDFEVRGPGNKFLGSSYAVLNITSPVEATAAPVEAAANGAQSFGLDIKNTSGAPIGGSVTLKLSGARQVAPVEAAFEPIAPGQSKRVSLSVPGLDTAGARWQASYQVRAGGIESRVTQDLASQPWSILGSFARDFGRDFGPEGAAVAGGVDLGKGYVDMMGGEQKWKPAMTGSDGLMNLADVLKPTGEATAYAITFVDSPTARAAVFSAGTDDGGKGWLNGKEVFADDGTHAASPGQQKIPVQLRAGRNEVLLKVTQGNGGWGFYFDLLDPASGQPLRDVKYSATAK